MNINLTITKRTLFVAFFIACVSFGFAQEKPKATIPSVKIKTMDGQTFDTKDITNDGKPVIISFWATWCKPCIAELLAIGDVYDDWVDETGVKLYAVSIDDTKTAAKVAPFVNGRAWDFEVLQDINWDFKRAMNVVDVPFLCVLNGKGEIVYQHTSYAPGAEDDLYEIIKKVAKGEY